MIESDHPRRGMIVVDAVESSRARQQRWLCPCPESGCRLFWNHFIFQQAPKVGDPSIVHALGVITVSN